jgi:hypothetical protein
MTKRPPNTHTAPEKPKSSRDARRLLAAIYAQEQSWRKVAERLGLKNPGHAWEMAHGKRHDTPEMKAAVKNAKAREARAFAGFRVERVDRNIDNELVKRALAQTSALQSTLKALNTEDTNHDGTSQPTTNGD